MDERSIVDFVDSRSEAIKSLKERSERIIRVRQSVRDQVENAEYDEIKQAIYYNVPGVYPSDISGQIKIISSMIDDIDELSTKLEAFPEIEPSSMRSAADSIDCKIEMMGYVYSGVHENTTSVINDLADFLSMLSSQASEMSIDVRKLMIEAE